MSLFRRPISFSVAIRGRAQGRGFTLVEMMVAVVILAILGLSLVVVTDNAARMWDRGESQNQNRVRTRALLDYMGRELRVATLAMNQGAVTTPTLQFLIDPPVGSACKYPDTIFWQAPIASDDHSLGNIAEIGYFVRWGADNHANLCRYFVNPTTVVTGTITSNPNYLIYSAASGAWVFGGTANPPDSSTGTAGSLDTVAPANALNNYQGLFLENVLGLWVQAYDIKGTLLTNPYDSSNPPSSLHALPAYLVLSVVMLSNGSANRLAINSSAIATIKGLYTSTTDAPSFLAAVRSPANNIPVTITSGASISSIQVSLDNYK